MHRGPKIVSATVIALLVACADPAADPPGRETLPEFEADAFDKSIREEIRAAYERVEADPSNAARNGALAMLLHAHSQFEYAEAFYSRAQSLEPSALNWNYYLGIVQQRQAKHEEAVVSFRGALKIDSLYGPIRIRLAESLLALGRLDEAGKLYGMAIEMDPTVAEAHYGLGRVLAAKGDAAASVEPLERACELGPRFGAAHYALALTYRNLGEREKAEQHLELYQQDRYGIPATADPLLAEVTALEAGAYVYLRRGIEFNEANRIGEAIAAHEKAIELEPDLVRARMNLVILYGRTGNFGEANKHYHAALATGAPHAELHYNFGVLATKVDRPREAKAAFSEALKLDPHYALAHNNLGFLLESEGERAEAERHYRLAIQNQPNYRLAHFHLGRLLAEQGRLRLAIDELQQTLQPVDEQTPQFLYALAATHGMLGEHEKTVEYGRRARKLAVEMGQTQLAEEIENNLNATIQ